MEIQIIDKLFIRHNSIDTSRQSIWLLHGFADSGLAYQSVFASPLNDHFNIYVVDLPGFGASPIHQDYLSIKSQATLLANIISKETRQQAAVNIAAHSLGALIGTWVCQILNEKINYYFSIEGNLTEADSYFSSKPSAFETARAFANAFEEEIFEKAKTEARFRNYYSSLKMADPEAMRNWGITSREYISGNKCGFEFDELTCNKVYIWGDVDTPIETQTFIKDQSIPNRLYPGVGHWHMLENTVQFYEDVYRLIKPI